MEVHPDFMCAGAALQVCAKIQEHPVFGAGLNQDPDLNRPARPVYVMQT